MNHPIHASRPADVARLRPGQNVRLVERRLPRELRLEFEDVAAGRSFERQLEVDARRPIVEPLIAPLSSKPARDFLRDDLTFLVREFGRVLGHPRLRVGLAVVRSDSCRKLHTDYVTLRMLCTYAGPGTEWLRNDDVRRQNLERVDGRCGTSQPVGDAAGRCVAALQPGPSDLSEGRGVRREPWKRSRASIASDPVSWALTTGVEDRRLTRPR